MREVAPWDRLHLSFLSRAVSGIGGAEGEESQRPDMSKESDGRPARGVRLSSTSQGSEHHLRSGDDGRLRIRLSLTFRIHS